MVDNVEEEFVLPGGRGSSADSIQGLCVSNVKEFGAWLDSYSGKAKFMKDLKQGQEDDSILSDWVEALCTKHDSDELSLAWSDLDEKDSIVEIFKNEKEVWKWLCTQTTA